MHKLFKRAKKQIKMLIGSLLAVFSLVLLVVDMPIVLALLPMLGLIAILLKRTYKRFKNNIKYKVGNETVLRVVLSLLPLIIYLKLYSDNAIYVVIFSVLPIVFLIEPIINILINGPKERFYYNILGAKPEIKKNHMSINYMANFRIAMLIIALLSAVLSYGFALLVSMYLLEVAVLLGLTIRYIISDNNKNFEEVCRALEEYQPKFALYFAAPKGTSYQVKMWIEYLNRIKFPYVIIVRHKVNLDELSKFAASPIVFSKRIFDVDRLVSFTNISVCFYVNNSMYNTHMVRYNEICHVQLLHGDSDKTPSFNPVTKMYDKVFVAGQAAIERYIKNDVYIPNERFAIVGRPQVEAVLRYSGNKRSTILYAPTWSGYRNDSSYSSLQIGIKIVRALIDRKQKIIFRPHPYSYKNKEFRAIIHKIHRLLESDLNNEHVWGKQAEKELSVFDCFNAADAMIADVSSVVPDFLFSEKPFAMTVMMGTQEEFEDKFPLAKVAYLIDRDLSNIDDALDELLKSDPKSAQRKNARAHYLGPFEHENYADNFVNIARKLITQNNIEEQQCTL